MKFATVLFVGLALLVPGASLQAAPPAGSSHVFIAFTGGSVWTSASTGTCVWYFPILGDMPLSSLFAPDASGSPVIDKEHAYLIWVSDWSIQSMFNNTGFGGSSVALAIVPAGSATIYYSNNPTSRDWSDVTKRGTWGIPVAKFIRGAGLFHSPDNFQVTDKFYFSAPLVSSSAFTLGNKDISFRELIPHGITCFEYGQQYSTTETGSCMSMGY
ncbi:MAG TPA: hypothetical protein VMU05_10490 [Dongiaceae bacterium]|nr:hypothetical protein [Dongiaceae bacterium]